MSSGSQKLSKFKRKTGTQSTRDYLLAQRTDLASSGKCSGILHGEGVLVQEPRDISELVHLGSYGKGVFSRSISTHHCLPQLSTDLSSLTPRSLISRSHAQQSANSRLHGLRSLLPTMSNDSACQHDRRHILHANSMLKVEKWRSFHCFFLAEYQSQAPRILHANPNPKARLPTTPTILNWSCACPQYLLTDSHA